MKSLAAANNMPKKLETAPKVIHNSKAPKMEEEKAVTPTKVSHQPPKTASMPIRKKQVTLDEINPDDIIINHIEYPFSLMDDVKAVRKFRTRIYFTWVNPTT